MEHVCEQIGEFRLQGAGRSHRAAATVSGANNTVGQSAGHVLTSEDGARALEHRASPQETQETGHPAREPALRARHYATTLATPRSVPNRCRSDATLRL